MKEVTIPKSRLLDIIIKNRDEHRTIHKEAMVKFKEKLTEVLESMTDQVAKGQIPKYEKLVHLRAPTDHTKDYDRAIRMLELEIKQEVTLDKDTFRNLVEDQWNWTRGWARTANTYTSSSKLDELLNDSEDDY